MVTLIFVGCQGDSPEPPPDTATSASPTATPEPEPLPTPEPAREIEPSVAGERPHNCTHHGISIDDPWHWLEDEDVIAYLEAENEYFDAKMAPHRELIDTICAEIEGRQPAELSSLPSRKGEWHYQWRYGEGSEYREWLRWPASGPGAREGPMDNAVVFLSEPDPAEGLEYFRLGSLSITNDWSKFAYSTDTDGSGLYTMVIRDLETEEVLEEAIEAVPFRESLAGRPAMGWTGPRAETQSPGLRG